MLYGALVALYGHVTAPYKLSYYYYYYYYYYLLPKLNVSEDV